MLARTHNVCKAALLRDILILQAIRLLVAMNAHVVVLWQHHVVDVEVAKGEALRTAREKAVVGELIAADVIAATSSTLRPYSGGGGTGCILLYDHIV